VCGNKIKVALLTLIWLQMSVWAGDLYVFLPGKAKPSEIKKEIAKNTSLTVTVFKSVKKLNKQIKKAAPVAVIAPSSVIEFSKGLKVQLKGKKGNASSEKYLLVAVNSNVTMANIKEKKVGVFDFLGRKYFKKFFPKYFGVKIKKMKRVQKQEDLLTLLGIDMVDAILVSKAELATIRKNSDIKLTVLSESKKKVAYPVVALGSGSAADVASLSKVSKKLLKKCGFESWGVK
jgi:hypothetical protein